ncbi:MAG TPA: N-acetylmuramoyl-L-alanine amidase [Verrucomicrobiae bacterium]|nr:N-acetylmuramoyl-L-alanine amidase [Verrucomicrobiae bacterium]
MRLLGPLLVLWAGVLTASSQSAFSRLERAALHGRDYVRLADWARANRFQVTQGRTPEEIRLTNPSLELVFAADSQRAEINGVTVFLSFPVAFRNGTPYVALFDLQTAVHPVLSPPRSDRRVPVINVCLDPGHGGRDPGNEEGRHKEKEYTMALAWEIKKLLQDAGLKVSLTRQVDSFVPLPDRPDFAKRHDAEIFVSLHFNATLANKSEVKGVEVYCLTPAGARSTYDREDSSDTNAWRGNHFDAKNMLLAYCLQKSMAGALPVEDRGVKRARFAVLKNAAMPAVLVEAGFMSHPAESRRIRDPAYRRQLAQAIVDGILSYKRQIER